MTYTDLHIPTARSTLRTTKTSGVGVLVRVNDCKHFNLPTIYRTTSCILPTTKCPHTNHVAEHRTNQLNLFTIPRTDEENYNPGQNSLEWRSVVRTRTHVASNSNSCNGLKAQNFRLNLLALLPHLMLVLERATGGSVAKRPTLKWGEGSF